MLNASSFGELRALRTEGIRAEGDRLRAEIVRLIREECTLRSIRGKLGEKKERMRTLTKEREGLLKQLPKPRRRKRRESSKTSRPGERNSQPFNRSSLPRNSSFRRSGTSDRAAHEKFMEAFRTRELSPRSYLRTDVTFEDLLQWLYEADHIHLSYGLKYNGVELEKLSPGTKGSSF